MSKISNDDLERLIGVLNADHDLRDIADSVREKLLERRAQEKAERVDAKLGEAYPNIDAVRVGWLRLAELKPGMDGAGGDFRKVPHSKVEEYHEFLEAALDHIQGPGAKETEKPKESDLTGKRWHHPEEIPLMVPFRGGAGITTYRRVGKGHYGMRYLGEWIYVGAVSPESWAEQRGPFSYVEDVK